MHPESGFPHIPVLAYHKIDPAFEIGVNSITPQVFEHQMRFLFEMGYVAITVNQLIQAVFTSDLPPRSILITFDDGTEDFYRHAYPILKKYGLTATVFMLAGYIGKLNTWDVRLRLKRLRHLSREQMQFLFNDGIEFASHGMYHRFLPICSLEEARIELQDSKSLLEDLLNQPIDGFSYPYGSVNAKFAKMVKSAGYRIAFGLNPNYRVREHASTPMYCFPRMAIYRYDTLQAFRAKLGLLGKSRFGFECFKNRIINRFAYLNRLRI
jgi:peptidoglycan/xylan/chitin deacetylase (PgdA/CDA1 family)